MAIDPKLLSGTSRLDAVPVEVSLDAGPNRKMNCFTNSKTADEIAARMIGHQNGRKAAEAIQKEIFDNPHLTHDQKRKILRRVRKKIPGLTEDQKRAIAEGVKAEFDPADPQFRSSQGLRLGKRLDEATPAFITSETSERHDAALTDIIATFSGELRLGRPNGSAFHKLREAFHRVDVLTPALNISIPLDMSDAYDTEHQIFIVEHDWAGAFERAKDFHDGIVRLPFEYCVFEFRICDRRVLACFMSEVGHRDCDAACVIYIETAVGWALTATVDFRDGEILQGKAAGHELSAIAERLGAFMWRHVRAVLIALEAEVATTETIRAPHKLNRARERNRKLPLTDYHVVSLKRRPRAEPLERPDDYEKRRSPRLHFRRGHWRHFQNHKTWIRWQLVGEPDLGFIDKHYRL